MLDLTKNQAVIEALESAGYQEIRLNVVPKRFLFSDGRSETEPACPMELTPHVFDMFVAGRYREACSLVYSTPCRSLP